MQIPGMADEYYSLADEVCTLVLIHYPGCGRCRSRPRVEADPTWWTGSPLGDPNFGGGFSPRLGFCWIASLMLAAPGVLVFGDETVDRHLDHCRVCAEGIAAMVGELEVQV